MGQRDRQKVMARKYNYIFSKLVKDKRDIVGHVAYAVYKFDKVAHIKKFKNEKGHEPTEAELKSFHESCCNEARIDEYKSRAEGIINDFSNMIISEMSLVIEEKLREEQDQAIEQAIRKALPSTKMQYVHGVFQGILTAVVLALLIWLAATVINKYSIGGMHITFEEQTQQIDKK